MLIIGLLIGAALGYLLANNKKSEAPQNNEAAALNQSVKDLKEKMRPRS